jgi:hypothetical protein
MTSTHPSRLAGRRLLAARIAWLTVAALALGLVVGTLPAFMREASAVATPESRTFSQLTQAELRALETLGLSARAYAFYVLAWTVAPLFIYILLASLIFQRRADDPVAFWMSLTLVGIGAAMPYLGGITDFGPAWQTVVYFVRALGVLLLLALFFGFPDGRLVPRWAHFILGAWAVWMVLWLIQPTAPWGLLDATGALTGPGLLGMLFGFGAGISAQVFRYRRLSTPLQRQQAKVFAFGFGMTFFLYILAVSPYFLFPGVRAPGWPYLLYGLVYVPLLTRLAFTCIPLIIGFAVLRYRLWDIDLIIRRTLIYGAVTSTLVAIYAGTVVTLQPLLAAVTGQQRSQLSTVISTLFIAALFNPLRGGLQRLIDRRFYRRKYDAGRALSAFNSTVTEEVDVHRLTERLVEVIGETLQPAHVSLWLRTSPGDGSEPPRAAV